MFIFCCFGLLKEKHCVSEFHIEDFRKSEFIGNYLVYLFNKIKVLNYFLVMNYFRIVWLYWSDFFSKTIRRWLFIISYLKYWIVWWLPESVIDISGNVWYLSNLNLFFISRRFFLTPWRSFSSGNLYRFIKSFLLLLFSYWLKSPLPRGDD